MFFNSYIFILLFIPMLLIGYFSLNYFHKYKLATVYLTMMSLWFYGYFNLYFLGAFVVSIVINYKIGLFLDMHENKCQTKPILIFGIVANTGYLFVCKYMDFFLESMNQALGTSLSFFKVAMPLGISFYTFQQIAYLVDCYRKETDHYSLFEYMAFMTFFPQVIEGPIVLHNEWMPKLRNLENRKVNYENLLKGFYGFSLGLAKKVLIADNLAPIVSLGYRDIMECSATDAWIVMICYALQLYFDFSGYCDMAYGLSTMLNLEVPINFNSPYKAVSIADFWDRWHMTLTRFFTKYVYIPLGGSRKGKIRTYINILLIFLLSGLWHGAAWNFIVWGLMNGIAMVIYRLGRKAFDKIPKVFMMAVTFLFDVFAWAMFRAPSVVAGKHMIQRVYQADYVQLRSVFTENFQAIFEIRILMKFDFLNLGNQIPSIYLLAVILFLLFAVFCMKNTQEKMVVYKPTNWKMIVAVVLLTWSVISLSNVSEFLYVNF